MSDLERVQDTRKLEEFFIEIKFLDYILKKPLWINFQRGFLC